VNQDLATDYAFRGDVKLSGPVPEVEETTPGTYPRMLHLGDEVEDLLKTYIDSEIEAFYTERQDLLEDWKDWQTLYWAKPEKKERTFPFKRAANIVIPLAAIAVEAIHARTMNTLFSVEPFWSIRPKSKAWVESAKPTERWLQSEVESSDSLDMYAFCNESLLELYKLGTAVAKSGYERLVKKTLRPVGDTEQEYYAVVRNSATVDRVPLASFVMRFAELDPQIAPLVGEKHSVSWSQLKKHAQAGRMDPEAIEKIKSSWRDKRDISDAGEGTELENHVQELAKAEPLWYSTFDFYELWISFDVDKDGWDEEIVVDYHKETGTFLSVRYNWYDDLHRPYRIANYFNVEGIWPGIGVCKQSEQFQAEVTAIHRQRLDNATLANMGMIVLRKGSGYGPGEPIFPGKMWFLDDVKDIAPLKLNEIYPSAYANEQGVVGYNDKRVGVNDLILGLQQEGTPATATSDVARLAESNKRFDLVLKNIKRWLSQIGVDVITNYQIFGDQQVHWLVLDEDGAYVEAVLRMPSVLVRRGAIIDLTVTDTITNREIEKAQWLQIFQVMSGFYQSIFQLSQVFGDPNITAQLAQKALIGTDEIMRRLLETYNITDTDKFTLSEKAANANAGSNGPPPGAGTTGFPPGVSSNGGGTGAFGGNRLGPGVGSS
jgi:hypothetical protein